MTNMDMADLEVVAKAEQHITAEAAAVLVGTVLLVLPIRVAMAVILILIMALTVAMAEAAELAARKLNIFMAAAALEFFLIQLTNLLQMEKKVFHLQHIRIQKDTEDLGVKTGL
jgi:hypothetical protein